MRVLNKKIIKVIIAAVLLLPMGAVAQTLTSSVNTYSPYSMYGLGEISTQGNVVQRSMGGAGVAMWSNSMVNMLNPAGYANTPRQSFLFNFGIEGGHFRNSQNKYTSSSTTTIKTAYNSVNIHDIAFQMPLAKGLGVGFSLTPYSNVGYTMFHDDLSSGVAGNVGRVRYNYNGEGDVTEVKIGAGWAPFKNFTIGAAMLYYWGEITRNYLAIPTSITGSGEYSTTTGVDTFGVSKIKAQFGFMWSPIMTSKNIFTIGATYDLGGALSPDVVKYVYVDNLLASVVRENKEDGLPLRLPSQIAAGVYYQTSRIRAGLDYVYQDWGDKNASYLENDGAGVKVAYTDTHTIKAGFELTPRPTDVRNFMNRVAYRVGARYGDLYQTFNDIKVKQYAVTAGVGIPVRLFGRSSVDVGFEFGMRRGDEKTTIINNSKVGLVKMNYYKISIGLTMFGEDRWFYRYKYD